MKKETLLPLYRQMLRIRRVEEAIAENYDKKEMRCPIHLSIGQEAVPVGLCAHLTARDRVYSTHRCHAHYLAKGGDLKKMIAELFGKATGCASGKGGSMHLVDVDKGMMGASALVGGTIPLAVGSAFAFSREKSGSVSVAFMGDGATEEGIFYESLNFAALRKLPVLFVVENNLYATYSHQSRRQADCRIAKRGEAFDIPSVSVDGNDAVAVYVETKKAVDRAREGLGPTLFEFATYRFRDHVGPAMDIEVGYRTQSEVESWMKRCPLNRLEEQLKEQGNLSASEITDYETVIQKEIEEAFAFARQSPFPASEEIYLDVFA